MQNITCPKCGHETAHDTACPGCGHAARNGAAAPKADPPPPPEVANWVISPTPPEMLEEYRRTFNEDEYLAAVREVERTGGVGIDGLIEELERKINGRP
jgi:hypothetical protein